MPVPEHNAYSLLHAFGMLEFTLKRTRGFVAGDGDPLVKKRVKAKADWQAVDKAIRALPADEFLDRISPRTKERMLGSARQRPQVQFVQVADDGTWRAVYKDCSLPTNDAEALVVAMRRVRNNLFHGGKEDPLDDPHNEDESWVDAATEVAELVLNLLDRQQLRP